MTSNPWFVAAVTTLLIVLSAFFVVIEFALLGARRHKLEQDAPNSRAARAALRGVNELTIMLAVAQLGITACTFALGAVTKPAVDSALGPVFVAWGAPAWTADATAFALSLLAVTFLHLVVGEMAPKSWAIAHPEFAAKAIALPSRTFAWLLRPLLIWVNTIANRLVAASGVEPVDRPAVGGRDADTIRQLVEHSASVGALDASFRTQISGLLDLERITVGDVIAAQDAPLSVAADATVGDVHEVAIRTGQTRVLVAQSDGTSPHLIHVRDTLDQPVDHPVEGLARDGLALDRSTPVYEALARMRDTHEQMAVVESEGAFIGLVSIGDIVRRVLPREAVVLP